jgi:hypothetical protein
VWDEVGGGLGAAIEAELRAVALAYENQLERTVQTVIGPSGIGNPCSRCLGRQILGPEHEVRREFEDPWCAIVGTAVHAWLDEACEYANITRGGTTYLTEQRVQPCPELLPKGGNADLYIIPRATVIDHKVVGVSPLRKYRLNGPGHQYRVQAHTYGLGYVLAGRPVEHVGIAFWPRGGRLSELYVWTEPFDVQIAAQGLERFRAIKVLVEAGGPAVLPMLDNDPDCWDCEGKR